LHLRIIGALEAACESQKKKKQLVCL